MYFLSCGNTCVSYHAVFPQIKTITYIFCLIVILRALCFLMHDRLVLVFLGCRGEALTQSRSDSGVYTGLLLCKPYQR